MLICDSDFARLVENFRDAEAGADTDAMQPVCRIVVPGSSTQWLLVELDPATQSGYGLADLGVGCPEFGSISVAELEAFRTPFNTVAERDPNWRPRATMGFYCETATAMGRIIA